MLPWHPSLSCSLGWLALGWLLAPSTIPAQSVRPNFLWITCDGVSPTFGCLGDRQAKTPNIDKFAARAHLYPWAYSHAAASGPTRSGVITGQYPTTIGAHHAPSRSLPAPEVRCFPESLRAAGYYCSNRGRTDYQLGNLRPKRGYRAAQWSPQGVWDHSGDDAHWRKRSNPKQPFFAVFDLGRPDLSTTPRQRDPKKIGAPAYLTQSDGVRGAVARYYEELTRIDAAIGKLLGQLEADGLADRTIVWIWSASGRELPRESGWLYDGGTRIPLLIRVPPRFQRQAFAGRDGRIPPSTIERRVVSTIDFAPTMLALAALPHDLPGQPFLGRRSARPRKYAFAARDRIEEAYDCSRSVRDQRFLYIRNYMPERPWFQPRQARDRTTAMRSLRALHEAGKLGPLTKRLFGPKPREELYDVIADRLQGTNLAQMPAYKKKLAEFREQLTAHLGRSKDVGFIPEVQFRRFMIPKQGVITCLPPIFRAATDDRGQPAVQIASQTRHATIEYQVDGRGAAGTTHWNIYSEPVTLAKGQVLTARASCLGHTPSATVKFRFGDRQASEAAMERAVRAPHWSDNLDRTGLLAKLHALANTSAMTELQAALRANPTDLQYWATRGILLQTKDRAAVIPTLEAQLESTSYAVRFAAAEALAKSEQHRARAVQTLRAGLKDPALQPAFAALQSLSRIGAHAAPARGDVEAFLERAGKFAGYYGYTVPPIRSASNAARLVLQNIGDN